MMLTCLLLKQLSYNFDSTVIVGEDIDLLIIMTARSPFHNKIYFLKPGKASVEKKMYSTNSLIAYPKCQNNILFLHAITGCDTTSAFFKRGKMKVLKLFEKRDDLVSCASAFTRADSSRETILTNGIRFLLAMYDAPKKFDSLDKYRHSMFVKHTRKNKSVQLSSLPPTSAAACQHLYRVYYQVQIWLGNELDPEDWGWVWKDNVLEPIQTLIPPAPEKLLNTIFCNCKKGCNSNCGCKKVGLFCSSICSNCQGQSCSNVEVIDDDIFDTNEKTFDASCFLEQTTEEDQENEEDEDNGEDEGEEYEEEDTEDDYLMID